VNSAHEATPFDLKPRESHSRTIAATL
jgi:hypothetical protein